MVVPCCIIIFCLTVVFTAGIAYAESDVNSTAELLSASKQKRNALIRAQFVVLTTEPNISEKTQIDELLYKLDNAKVVNLKNVRKATSSHAVAEVNTVTAQSNIKDAETILNEETIKQLEELSKDVNAPLEPLGIAESLYATGKHKQAVKYYEIALARKVSMGKELSNDDLAWIMLQIAQCRADEPNAAAKILSELVTEYPNSTWVQVASAKRQMFELKSRAYPKKDQAAELRQK
jgi:hypothetical protein